MQEAEIIHADELHKLKNEFGKAIDRENLNTRKFLEQYNITKSRFDNRESRCEDVSRVNRLEQGLET